VCGVMKSGVLFLNAVRKILGNRNLAFARLGKYSIFSGKNFPSNCFRLENVITF